MKLTDCFDRVHVINLPYKEDRRERLSTHLREVGLADPDELHWERAISGDQCWAPAYFLAGNGPRSEKGSGRNYCKNLLPHAFEPFVILLARRHSGANAGDIGDCPHL